MIDRVCCECGGKYRGERNTCPACHNLARRKSGKFGAEYHRNYYHKRYSKSAILRDKGELTKQGPIAQLRKAAFEKQKCRIRSELLSITIAKLNPNEDSIEQIEAAGVKLQGLTIEKSNHRLTQIFADKNFAIETTETKEKLDSGSSPE